MFVRRALRPLAAVFGFAAVALLGAALLPSPAYAATPTPTPSATTSSVTWSVRPANVTEADGRSWVEQTLLPGASRQDYLALHNFSASEVAFSLTAADGYFTEAGRFSMLPADQESADAGTWISIVPSVTVGPDQTVIVPFTTSVPDNAQPGDHAAGVAASITTSSDGTGLSIDSRVGFRVMTRVAGPLAPSAEVTGVASDYRTAWNPFTAGAVDVGFTISNTGNTRLLIGGTVMVGGVGVEFATAGSENRELLPGESRRFEVRAPNVWPVFLLQTDVSGQLPSIALDGTEVPPIALKTSWYTWAIPLPQLILVGGLALVILGVSWSRARGRRRVRDLVLQAREEGIREGSVATPDGTGNLSP